MSIRTVIYWNRNRDRMVVTGKMRKRNVEEFLVVIQFFLNCVPHFWAYFASEPSISSVFYGKGLKNSPKL